jgi:hypothetical protein
MQSWTHPKLRLVGIPQIRLLQIEADHPSSPIRCRLQTFDLEDCPVYTALSYCWGPEENAIAIKLQRKTFIVRRNLGNFLFNERLRRENHPEPTDGHEWMWIDALCIDQTNDYERNHQVNLMSKIYQGAKQVLIWLGAGNPLDICQDVNWIMVPQGLEQAQKLVYMATQTPTRSVMTFLHSLGENPYWTRIWIIQEIMFGQQIFVRWGPIQFNWDELELFFEHSRHVLSRSLGVSGSHYLASQRDSPRDVTRELRALDSYLDEIARSKAKKVFYLKARFQESSTSIQTTFELYQLMVWFHSWNSTDVRDKVYALLGLASDSLGIMPDYEKTSLAVFRDLVDRVLKQDGKGHLLSRRMEVSGFLASAVFGMSRLRAEKEEYWRYHCKVHRCSMSYHEHGFSLVSYDGREYSLKGIDCPRRGSSVLTASDLTSGEQ